MQTLAFSLSELRHPLIIRTVWIVAALAAAVMLAALYGLLPGQLPAAAMQQFFLGLAMCYADNLPWVIHCEAVAHPEGYTTMFGLPVVLGVASLHALGLPLVAAGKSISLGLLTLAAWGCFRLAAGLGMRPWVAALIAVLFLASPIVFAQDGYGHLRLGFALVPLYAWLDWHFAQRLLQARNPQTLWRTFALGLVVLTLSRNFSLFCDGYSFVMGLMLSGLLTVSVWLTALSRRNWTLAGVLPLLGLIPTVLAYVIYRSYVGAAVEDVVMPIDYFRGQGVDVYALLVPSRLYWLFDWLGLAHSLSGWQTFSDGPNVLLVYLGWVPLLLSFVAVAGWLRARGGISQPQGLAISSVLAAALISLLLSLGPSLKIANFRSDPPPGRFIEFSDYQMPADAASFSLGSDWMYLNVPGLRNMRAVYRWNLLCKLCLLLLAGLGIEWLARQPQRRWLAVMVAVPLIAEALPNVASRIDSGRRSLAQFERFEQQAATTFSTMGLHGQRVLLLPVEGSLGWNHYLANFLCPYAGTHCYNAGGDKSLASARRAWPPAMRELARGRYIAGNLRALMQDPAVDAIVVPLFDLRQAAYVWPPSPQVREQFLQEARELADQAGLGLESGEWFVQLSVPAQTTNRTEAIAGHFIDVLRWGPKSTNAGIGFNVQGDGRSALWFELANAEAIDEALVVLLDGHVLDTYQGVRSLSARLWSVEAQTALPPGAYRVSIRHRERGIEQEVGVFHVEPASP